MPRRECELSEQGAILEQNKDPRAGANCRGRDRLKGVDGEF
jgi:hypothetical protein